MTAPPPPKKLLDVVREVIRLKHYSYRTEQTYIDWIKRYLRFYNKRPPREMGVPEIPAFLTHLAVEGQVAASTQNQDLSALLFLYRNVLQIELGNVRNFLKAKRPKRLPTVLTPEEVQEIIQHLTGVERLVVQLLYGSGLRLAEALNLRIKDVDSAQYQLSIRDLKGNEESRHPLTPERTVVVMQRNGSEWLNPLSVKRLKPEIPLACITTRIFSI